MEHLLCPITRQIYKEPVVAKDGYVYEKDVIEEWFKNHKKSPLSNIPIKSTLIKCYTMKNIIEKYLEDHPEHKKEQYGAQEEGKFDEKNFYKYFNENKIDELINYISKFNTFSLEESKLKFAVFKNDILVKYFIDHNIQITNTASTTSTTNKLLHFVCGNSAPEIIKYMIDKSVDLEIISEGGWRPIHIVCRYSTPEVVISMINKGVNLNTCTPFGVYPIHIACRFLSYKVIKHMIERGSSLTMNITYTNTDPEATVAIISMLGGSTVHEILTNRIKKNPVQNKKLIKIIEEYF